MKVAITGHTSGLGKALFDLFSIGNQVTGFSRSNGYDIRNFKKIVDRIHGYDVFINNAYDKYSQIDLLREVFLIWQDQPKTIINISSLASSNLKSFITKQVSQYSVHKAALDSQVHQLQMLQKKCRIINLRPGYFGQDKIDVNVLAKFINFIHDHKLYILETTLLHK